MAWIIERTGARGTTYMGVYREPTATNAPPGPGTTPRSGHHLPRVLFATTAGTPISRNTFRTRIWLPAVNASGIDFPVRVRVHDLRHAHASWLLAAGQTSSP